MQKTVTKSNEGKSLFSSYLEVLEKKEKQAQAERQLQEEKYLRRTQRIYEFHERQRREAVELRRCLEYVSQHAHVLESVLRGANNPESTAVPLSASLVKEASELQTRMAQCVNNASKIRQLLTASHRDQMDNMLSKMESELKTWTSFLQRAVNATYNTETVIDNLHNMIAEQRRCVHEVSNSSVFTALCGPEQDSDSGSSSTSERDSNELSPVARTESAPVCSTPLMSISHD